MGQSAREWDPEHFLPEMLFRIELCINNFLYIVKSEGNNKRNNFAFVFLTLEDKALQNVKSKIAANNCGFNLHIFLLVCSLKSFTFLVSFHS